MKKLPTLNAVTLFTSAGVAETFFSDLQINVAVANELLQERCDLYSHLYPETHMVCGDITEKKVFEEIIAKSPKKVNLLIASPPCQGISVAGKNRNNQDMLLDERNYLIKQVFKFITLKRPTYILIENVPTFLKLKLPHKKSSLEIIEILEKEFGSEYEIKSSVLDAADYGVPQTRKRAIILMHKKNTQWEWPKKSVKKVTVRDAIGHLPSLEAGEVSKIKWHYARKHTKEHIECMSHTPEGESAFDNEKYYPRKKNGDRVKGYQSSYRRISWDKPAPTITMRNDAISSQRNVHPGRKKRGGLYSDARVLTPLELIILSSLPQKWPIPSDTREKIIRDCLGECIPPKLIKAVLNGIKR